MKDIMTESVKKLARTVNILENYSHLPFVTKLFNLLILIIQKH